MTTFRQIVIEQKVTYNDKLVAYNDKLVAIIWENNRRFQDLMVEINGLKEMIRDLEDQLMKANGEIPPIPKIPKYYIIN